MPAWVPHGVTRRVAARTLELVGRAGRSVTLSIDPHCHRYSSYWTPTVVTPEQLSEQVLNGWCGGDRRLAARVLAGAYLRYLPWRVLRSVCWALFLTTVVCLGGLLVTWPWPYLVVKIIGVVILLLVLLGSLLYVQRPACLVRTATAGSQDRGLLNTRVHRAALARGWRTVEARRVASHELEEILTRQGASAGVIETALKLHADGWDGTCGDLCHAAEIL